MQALKEVPRIQGQRLQYRRRYAHARRLLYPVHYVVARKDPLIALLQGEEDQRGAQSQGKVSH